MKWIIPLLFLMGCSENSTAHHKHVRLDCKEVGKTCVKLQNHWMHSYKTGVLVYKDLDNCLHQKNEAAFISNESQPGARHSFWATKTIQFFVDQNARLDKGGDVWVHAVIY